MADIKLGYGCGIKATLLMPTGAVCDLRDALFVNAVLVLPNGSTMYAKDISADNVTNAIYVRLLADRELTTEGNYSILFNVKLVDGVMYSTVAVNFANVTTNADAEYKEIVLSSNLEVTDNPHNVQRTGASPKVSSRQTWLVYNDEAKAYEDTGIPAEVNLGDYYTKEEVDGKTTKLESDVDEIVASIKITNSNNLASRASKSIAINPSKGDVYVFEIKDVENAEAVVTLANAASPFGAATLKTIATTEESNVFIYEIEDEYLEEAKYIVFSHKINTESVVSYNAVISKVLPQNKIIKKICDDLDDFSKENNEQKQSIENLATIVKGIASEAVVTNASNLASRASKSFAITPSKGDVYVFEVKDADNVEAVITLASAASPFSSATLKTLAKTTDNKSFIYEIEDEYLDTAKYIVFSHTSNTNSVVSYKAVLSVESPQNKLINELTNGGIKSSVKVLCFGNSFSQDSMSYVPSILKNLCPNLNVSLGIAVKSACSLAQHLANFTKENQTLNGTTIEPSQYSYQYWDGSAWVSSGSKNVDDILSLEDWDIITFQQNGGAAFKDWSVYYAPFIYKLHKSLFGKLNRGVKIGWLLTHSSYASTEEEFLEHWQGTSNNSKKVMESTGCGVLFPYGTAVQNLRTTSLKSLGDGEGNNLCADSVHLQEGIGCLTSAYTNALVILNSMGLSYKGVIGEQTRVDENFISEINVLGQNVGTSGVIGITEDNCYLAQVAAELAIKQPYEISNMLDME